MVLGQKIVMPEKARNTVNSKIKTVLNYAVG